MDWYPGLEWGGECYGALEHCEEEECGVRGSVYVLRICGFLARGLSPTNLVSLRLSQPSTLNAGVADRSFRFQAIEGDSAVQSGIHNLPIILSVVVSSIAAGGDVAWLGYYVPFLILGSVLTSVGGGLLMTLGPNSGTGAW